MNNKVDYSIYDKNIEDINIADSCMEFMRIYAVNNNIMRHLSSVYDGLSIGERRILFTMYNMGLLPNANHKKVATITGKTMEIHPHGDDPISDSIVKMGQYWNNTIPYVDGSGNFGSSDNPEHGAARYINARLSKYAYKCFFEEYSPSVVDMRLDAKRDGLEPEYLPSKYPNALINNVFGIAYGLTTHITTHNFKEVITLTRQILQDPDYNKIVLYPDIPTGASIVDDGQFSSISKTGTGKYRMRGLIDIDKDHNCLIVRNTPLQRYWNTIEPTVIELLGGTSKSADNRLVDIQKKREKDGNISTYLYLKKEVDPEEIRNLIYLKTDMELTSGISFNLTDVYSLNKYNVKSIIDTWIDFRLETKRRYFQSQLSTKLERRHIVEILLRLLSDDNAERFINIMRNSYNKKEIIESLMRLHGLTSLQADYIANLKGYQYSRESKERYTAESAKLEVDIKRLDDILISEDQIIKYIDEDLLEGVDLFGGPRKSKIITIDNTQTVANTKHVLVFTANGLVKKLPKGLSTIGSLQQGDYPVEVIRCTNKDILLLFDDRGYASKVLVSNIPSCTLEEYGNPISSYSSITGKLVSVLNISLSTFEKNINNIFVTMITKKGIIKRSSADVYLSIRSSAQAIIMDDDDSLVSAIYTIGDSDVIIYTNKGNGVRISTSEVRVSGRTTRGVKSAIFDDDEFVSGIDEVGKKDSYMLIITNTGKVKKCTLDYFVTQKRATKPFILIDLLGKDSIKFVHSIKGNEKFIVQLVGTEYTISAEDIPELPRLAKGTKLISVPRGESIINIRESK